MSSATADRASSSDDRHLSILDLHAMQKALQDLMPQESDDDSSVVIASIASKLDIVKDPGLHSLPTEVLEQINALAKTETLSPSQATDKSWPVNEEYPLLKTMRLVNPSFNKVASRFLFRIVILYEHPDRYDALNKIANVPYLAPLVEGVQIANLGYLPDCCYSGDEVEAHECRTDEACGSFDYWQSITNRTRGPCSTFRVFPPAGGPFANLDFSPEACYQRYVAWRDGERTMKALSKAGTAPAANLHLLPNLRSVDTVGLHEMRVIKRKPRDFDLYGNPWIQRPETRRFYETGLIEENAFKGRTDVALCHLPTFIIAASACGKDITCLTVHRLDHLFKVAGCDNNGKNPALQLRALRRLEINLTEIWYPYGNLDDPTELAPWVHDLNNLEELAIYQNPDCVDFQADVLRLLRNVTLPKLAKIDLKDGLVGFKVLKQFLSRHNGTLKDIEILNPFMEQERWDKIRGRYAVESSLFEGKKIWMSKLVNRNFVSATETSSMS